MSQTQAASSSAGPHDGACILVSCAILLACSCGSRTGLEGQARVDAGPLDATPTETSIETSVLPLPPGRVFAASNLYGGAEPAPLYWDLDALSGGAALPHAVPVPQSPGRVPLDIALAGNRLYVSDGSNGIFFFDALATPLGGPTQLSTIAVDALAYDESTDSLYASTEDLESQGFQTPKPMHIARFDDVSLSAMLRDPTAEFDLPSANLAPVLAPNGDLVTADYGCGGDQAIIQVVKDVHGIATGSTPATFELVVFEASWPVKLAADSTRLWVSGTDRLGSVVLGYELAALGPKAVPDVTLRAQVRDAEYVSALEARADTLFVALAPKIVSGPTGGRAVTPPVVAIFTGASTLSSSSMPSRVLTYPGPGAAWCDTAILTLRYSSSRGGMLFAGGWGYLAVDGNPLASPVRYVIDPCDPQSGPGRPAPPAYSRIEPVHP